MNMHRPSRAMAVAVATTVLSTVAPVLAANRTWDGGGGDLNFNTAANWTANTKPTSATNDTAIFNDGGFGADASYTVTLGGDQSIETLRFGTTGASAAPLNKNLTIEGNTLAITALAGSNGINYTNQAFGNATINSNITLSSNPTFNSGGSGTFSINGVIGESVAGSGFVKDGDGALTLRGLNTYTGATVIRRNTLLLGANSSSGAAGALGNSALAIQLGDSGTTGTWNVGVQTIGAFTIGRDIVVNATASTSNATVGGSAAQATDGSTFSGTITLNRGVQLVSSTTPASGAVVDFTGLLTGTGGVTKGQPGAIRLSNADNNYAGDTVIRNGSIEVATTGSLGAGTKVTLSDASSTGAAVISLVGNSNSAVTIEKQVVVDNFNTAVGSNSTLGGIGAGATIFTETVTLNRVVTQLTSASTGENAVRFDGAIAGTGGVNKVGAGTVVLTADNTYVGTTKVTTGTLALVTTGTNNIATSSAIIVGDAPGSTAVFDVTGVAGGFVVGAGQTIGGHGTFVGPLTIAGTLSPGTSIGTSTFDDDVTLSGTTSIEIDSVSGALFSDLVNGLGVITLGGVLSIVDIDADSVTSYAAGDSWNLFDGTLAGAFSSVVLPELGAGLSWDASELTAGGEGILTVVAVPEPAATSLALGAVFMSLVTRRRRASL